MQEMNANEETQALYDSRSYRPMAAFVKECINLVQEAEDSYLTLDDVTHFAVYAAKKLVEAHYYGGITLDMEFEGDDGNVYGVNAREGEGVWVNY